MTKTFIEFLSSSNEQNSYFKSFSSTSLTKGRGNTLFQETLETLFGHNGAATLAITDNQALSPACRSFYLKMAMLTSQQECYDFLDYIYAAIVAKKPGHYWDLLLAIKQINDHCNDTLIRHQPNQAILHIEKLASNATIFPNNIGSVSSYEYNVSPLAIKLAIQTLIRRQVLIMNANVRAQYGQEAGNTKIATEQQKLALELDYLTPNGCWRLEIFNMPYKLIKESKDPVVLEKLQAMINEELRRKFGVIVPINNCFCEQCNQNLDLMVSPNKIAEYTERNKKFALDDAKRYQADLDSQTSAEASAEVFIASEDGRITKRYQADLDSQASAEPSDEVFIASEDGIITKRYKHKI